MREAGWHGPRDRHTLAAAGVAVVVTDRQPAGVPNRRQEVLGVTDEGWRGVDSLTDEITAAGGQAISVLGDIAQEADARRIVDTAAAWRGRLDILVNVAAAPQGLDRRDVEEVPVELFDLQIAVALRGTFLMSRFAVPHMRPTGGAGSSTSPRWPAWSPPPGLPGTRPPRQASWA